VYVHGMPGGQYTNLREQARALGIDEARWPEVARAYAEVNDLLGDIIKVTPTSKVVGDLALLMASAGISRQQVLDPDTEVAFPESVVQLLRGELGQPYGGWPPLSCIRVSSKTTRASGCCTAIRPSCRRRCFSTAWSPGRRSRSISSAARRSSCATSP
jgi:pyruvate carboxylase